ncbi:MAG: class I SAM-dependent methyltransferase [Phycisphaerales bacterium]
MLAEVDAADALRRVLDAFESLGYPRAVVEQWSIPAADATDLVAALRGPHPTAGTAPRRILEVGTFVGTSALLMLLALPDAEVHTVDPNLPLEVEFNAMNCETGRADLARRTQEVAAAAAERLGVRDRLHLHQGGFSTDATFAGRDAVVPAIGAEVLAAHGPFDAAFIDGLHFEQAVLSDLVLAARGIREAAPIVLHDAIGYWGAPVRRAISRFLETEPSFALTHPPYDDLYRSIAVLSRESAADGNDFGSRAHRAFGSSADRLAALLARAIATQLPPVHAVDHGEAARVAPHLTGDGNAPLLVVALDALDRTPHAALDETLRALASPTPAITPAATPATANPSPQADAMLLGLTPPGESGAACTHSRPLATTVAALDRVGFDAFDAVIPFLEPFSYPLGAGCVLPTRTSFLSISVIAIRRGTPLHAAAIARGLDPLDARSARSIESARTQRTHDRASLARFRAEHAELNARIDALAAQATTARDSAQQSLLHEVESLRTRLQHMLDWRIHIGRHHFWRRPGARL